MKQFLSVSDVSDPMSLVDEAIALKKDPYQYVKMGENKVLGMIFFNPSLRTRMSTTRAAYQLGIQVITLNVTSDLWTLETNEGQVMDSGNAEHVKDAAMVMGDYCDILAIRSFPTLIDREQDYREELMRSFSRYSNAPIISLESATLHPLQSLADLITIKEYNNKQNPKIVMTWAPHVKALPQAVPNSFAQWIGKSPYNLTIAHPPGMELSEEFTSGATITHNQSEALADADFVFVKNWSSYHEYGKVHQDASWEVTLKKMKLTNNAKLMHCLPVRRNVVISDDALDSDHSVIRELAFNRIASAQVVLKKILESR